MNVKPGQFVECSESYAAPITDSVINPGNCAVDDLFKGFGAVLGGITAVGLGAVFAISAYRGYHRIDPERCREAKRTAAQPPRQDPNPDKW
jgi:hypothetical protein